MKSCQMENVQSELIFNQCIFFYYTVIIKKVTELNILLHQPEIHTQPTPTLLSPSTPTHIIQFPPSADRQITPMSYL